MTIPATLYCFLLFLRSVFTRRTLAAYRPRPELPASPPSDSKGPTELPKSATLGGMPLHLLLTERANFGATLRETLLHRPSKRDG